MLKAQKIIVVDDDKDLAESLADILEFNGHTVELAHSSEAAIQAVQQQDFDLVFLDIVMPGMNGVECLQQIHDIKPAAKVFLMTGYSRQDLQDQGMTFGALDVLHKPIPATKILEILQAAMC